MLTGVFNIAFGFCSSIFWFAVFWGLNGWFQGMGWPPSAKILTHWFSKSERGTWWAIWSTAHSVGGFLIPIIASICAQKYGWQYAMHVPGFLCILMGFLLIYGMRDTPQSLGLPPVEKFKEEDCHEIKKENGKYKEKELSIKEILFKYVLTNQYVWLLGIAYFFVYVVRTAVNDWSALYLFEHKGYSQAAAGRAISWFEGGGFVGILLIGWCSDFFFKGKRAPLNILFSTLVLGPVIVLWFIPQNLGFVDNLCIASIGFFIYGPQMLIGLNAAELAHKKAAATATGFVGCFAYVGAAFTGWPLGKMMEVFGWEAFFVVIVVSSIISTLALLPTWSAQSKRAKQLKQKPTA